MSDSQSTVNNPSNTNNNLSMSSVSPNSATSAANSPGSYLSTISSYIPNQFSFRELTSYLTGSSNNNSNSSNISIQSPVLYKSFQSYIYNNHQPQLFVLVVLTEGFQIFKLQSSTECRLIAQQRINQTITVIKLLQNTSTILAAIAINNTVRIYSLLYQSICTELTFNSTIIDIQCSNSSIAVCLDGEIHIYSNPIIPAKFNSNSKLHPEFRFQTACHTKKTIIQSTTASEPNTVRLTAICALGPRWLAYAPSELVPSSSNSPILSPATATAAIPHSTAINIPAAVPISNPNLSSPVSLLSVSPYGSTLPNTIAASLPASSDSISATVKGLASGLYNVGSMSRKSIANYLNGNTTSAAAITAATGVTADNIPSGELLSPLSPIINSNSYLSVGTVIVRDLQSDRIITHIRAHPESLAHLTFDPSGTLLVTVSIDAQYLNVYQIINYPRANITAIQQSQSNQYSSRILYRLFRGITHAEIRSISFSSDSKWISVCSNSGTTHLFPINLHGGPINANTHGPNTVRQPQINQAALYQRYSHSATAQPRTVSAIYRIKPSVSGSAPINSTGSINRNSYIPVISTFARLSNDPTSIDNLLVITWTEQLIVYKLSTVYREGSLTPLSNQNPNPNQSLLIDNNSSNNGSRRGSGVGAALYNGAQHVSAAAGSLVNQLVNGSSSIDNSRSGASTPLPAKIDLLASPICNWDLQSSASKLDELISQNTINQYFAEIEGKLPKNINPGLIAHTASVTAPAALPYKLPANSNSNSNTLNSKSRTGSPQLTGKSSPALNSIRPTVKSHSSDSLNTELHSNNNNTGYSQWLQYAELRTFSSSEVPLWASPQFILKVFDSVSNLPGSIGNTNNPSNIFILDESTGLTIDLTEPPSHPLQYDKFQQFKGINNTNNRYSNQSDTDDDSDVSNKITEALSSVLLDGNTIPTNTTAVNGHLKSNPGRRSLDHSPATYSTSIRLVTTGNHQRDSPEIISRNKLQNGLSNKQQQLLQQQQQYQHQQYYNQSTINGDHSNLTNGSINSELIIKEHFTSEQQYQQSPQQFNYYQQQQQQQQQQQHQQQYINSNRNNNTNQFNLNNQYQYLPPIHPNGATGNGGIHYNNHSPASNAAAVAGSLFYPSIPLTYSPSISSSSAVDLPDDLDLNSTGSGAVEIQSNNDTEE